LAVAADGEEIAQQTIPLILQWDENIGVSADIMAFSRDAGDFVSSLGYAEQLARITPDDRDRKFRRQSSTANREAISYKPNRFNLRVARCRWNYASGLCSFFAVRHVSLQGGPLIMSELGLGCVKTFWAVAEPGETRVNNAEQAQFDVLFVASLELTAASL
jgi:hypothetical protein